MRILVFGKTGQVATHLRDQQGVTALGRDEADLTDPAACAAAVFAANADAVINAAAYTGVDTAETDEAAAHLVNAEAPGAMARAARSAGGREAPRVSAAWRRLMGFRGRREGCRREPRSL